MPDKEERILAVNDEIDLTSLLSVLLENFNLLISIFLATIPVLGIYYLTSTEVFKTQTLLEIQNQQTA